MIDEGDDVYLCAAASRQVAILETWRRKKEEVRRLIDALGALQNKAHILSGKLDALRIAGTHQIAVPQQRLTHSHEHHDRRPTDASGVDSGGDRGGSQPDACWPAECSVPLVSQSPPRELATAASEALVDSEGDEEHEPNAWNGKAVHDVCSVAGDMVGVPSQRRDMRRWRAKRESLKAFFGAACQQQGQQWAANAPHAIPTVVSPPSPSGFMLSEPPSPRAKPLSPCASATVTRPGSPNSRMESVVDGFIAAVPSLVDGANRMRRVASQMHTGITQRKPLREDVLREMCTKRGGAPPLHAVQPPSVRPPSYQNAQHVVTVRVALDGMGAAAEWASCRLSCIDEEAPTQFWVDAASAAAKESPLNPSGIDGLLPLWLFVGCWRGRVLDDGGPGGSSGDTLFSASLEPICPSQFRQPLTFRSLRLGFATFDALERFVTLFRSGQRRIANEWTSSQRVESLL